MAHKEKEACCKREDARPKPWYRQSLLWISAPVFYFISFLFISPKLVHYRVSFLEYAKLLAIPIAIGFLLGGLIDYYIPQSYITKFLASHKRRTVFYASALGLLMSACSHGIIALSMELHKKGASGPAVVSFLLASPWANLPITILLIGFFGWRGFLIIFGALAISITTGLALQALDRQGRIEKNRHTVVLEKEFSIRADIVKRWKSAHVPNTSDLVGIVRGMISLADMILGWILIGMILASLVSAFVPEHFFHKYMGATFGGLLVTMLIATVFEVCSEGTSPLAFEIYKQTGAFGNAFVFLMGGVVTDYTEIGLLWSNLGRKTALWTLGISIPQVLFLGWIFNQI